MKETAAVTLVIHGALQRLQGQEGRLRSARLSPEALSTWQVPAHEAAQTSAHLQGSPKKPIKTIDFTWFINNKSIGFGAR